jgi:hypothetical protein
MQLDERSIPHILLGKMQLIWGSKSHCANRKSQTLSGEPGEGVPLPSSHLTSSSLTRSAWRCVLVTEMRLRTWACLQVLWSWHMLTAEQLLQQSPWLTPASGLQELRISSHAEFNSCPSKVPSRQSEGDRVTHCCKD